MAATGSNAYNSGRDMDAVFSNGFWRPFLAVFYTISLSALTLMISKRSPPITQLVSCWCTRWRSSSSALNMPHTPDATPSATRRRKRSFSGPRLTLFLTLIASFAYVFTAYFLTLGLGTSRRGHTCDVGVWICIGLYASTKVFENLFLVERIHIVRGAHVPRRRSKLYIFNILVCGAWIACLAIFISIQNWGRIRPSDGACLYYINHTAIIAVVCVDLLLNCYFSLLFAVPLARGQWANAGLKNLAYKSLIAAVVSLFFSAGNTVTIAVMKGLEVSWVCLFLCSIDAMGNASALFTITKCQRAPTRITSSSTVSIPYGAGDATPPTTQTFHLPSISSYDPHHPDHHHILNVNSSAAATAKSTFSAAVTGYPTPSVSSLKSPYSSSYSTADDEEKEFHFPDTIITRPPPPPPATIHH